MAMMSIVKKEDYWYETGIDCLDERAIGESKRQFEELREKGVIQSAQYQSLVWQMYDGVHMPMSLSFALNEVVFVQRGTQLFGCSLYDYQQTMRVVVTSKMGMSISWLQTLCVALRSMADRGEQFEVERYAAHAEVMQDFLTLLPGDSGFRRCLIDKLDELRLKNKMAQRQQRVLLDYKSYIIFDHYLKKFWSTAKQEEKVLYFPVWFWWHITVIIPLRPTECVLTPRACIKEERGKYYLAIRRTKLKGTTMGCEYSLEKDYSIEEFEVPEIFAHEIKDYIRATDREFVADIDSLFSKANQFTELKQWRNDNHYTYSNLHQCLMHFYRKVLVEKYGLTVVGGSETPVLTGEIGKIALGDTRHIAMVSLMVSGGSPEVCRYLAGHKDINVSSNYYSNVITFLDALVLCKNEIPSAINVGKTGVRSRDDTNINVNSLVGVKDGFCLSSGVKEGNFCDCKNAVDMNGRQGNCVACRYFLPKGTKYIAAQFLSSQDSVQRAFLLLKEAIKAARNGVGKVETIESAMERLHAAAEQYIHCSAILRKYKEGDYERTT